MKELFCIEPENYLFFFFFFNFRLIFETIFNLRAQKFNIEEIGHASRQVQFLFKEADPFQVWMIRINHNY